MEGITVFFYCHSCNQQNRQELGMPGYEFKQVEYDSLSEAVAHYNQTGHEISAFIRNDE